MKIGLSRKENAKETWSVCTMETFMEKVKCETKGGYITRLRESIGPRGIVRGGQMPLPNQRQ